MPLLGSHPFCPALTVLIALVWLVWLVWLVRGFCCCLVKMVVLSPSALAATSEAHKALD
jgi:hypothetical protein